MLGKLQSKHELTSDVPLWTPNNGHTSVGRPVKALCGHSVLSKRL